MALRALPEPPILAPRLETGGSLVGIMNPRRPILTLAVQPVIEVAPTGSDLGLRIPRPSNVDPPCVAGRAEVEALRGRRVVSHERGHVDVGSCLGDVGAAARIGVRVEIDLHAFAGGPVCGNNWERGRGRKREEGQDTVKGDLHVCECDSTRAKYFVGGAC